MRAWTITAALVLLGGCGGEGGGERPAVPGDRADPVAAREVFDHGPFLGVACPAPNRIDCDRVGLAVWLKHPADAVEAEIDGRRIALDDPDYSPGNGRLFTGYLQPAGLGGAGPLAVEAREGRWLGQPPVSAKVRFTIRHPGARPLTTTTTVPLHAGFG